MREGRAQKFKHQGSVHSEQGTWDARSSKFKLKGGNSAVENKGKYKEKVSFF